MDSNKNLAYEPEERLQTVIYEFETTISDLLDKADFALMELKEGLEDIQKGPARRMIKAETYADIAYDYLTRAQSALTDIVLTAKRGQVEGGNANE